MMTLTPEGRRFVLFTLAVGAAALNTGNNVFYLLLAMMLSVALVSVVLSGLMVRRLTFRRHLPDCFFAKAPVSVGITVKNGKANFPSLSLRLSDVIDGQAVDRDLPLQYIAPRSTLRMTYTLVMDRRGCYCLDGLQAATSFPFGLFRMAAVYSAPQTLIVCPELLPLPATLLRELTAVGQERGLDRRGTGMGLYNLREYRPGDDSRAIHWRTTARTSKLMLKETEAEDQRQVTIRISLVAPIAGQEAVERAVSVGASLILWFHQQGYGIRVWIGEQPTALSATEADCYAILHALALCERREPIGPLSMGSASQGAATPVAASPAATPHPSGMPSDAGTVVSIIPWVDNTGDTFDADCTISTAEPGAPLYAVRTRLQS